MNRRDPPDKNAWKILRAKSASPGELRAHFHEHQAPVNVDRIIRGLGIELSEGRGGTSAAELSFSEAQARLKLSLEEAPDARRFAMASLIGHLMLDPPGEYRAAFLRESQKPDPKASKYAKELLMPITLLAEALREETHDGLATRFRVQPAVLEEWLNENGLGDAERRRHERIPARIQIRFLESGNAARALRAYSLNLSVGGLCIKTQRTYEVGEPVRLEMSVEKQNFQLVGEVAWIRAGAIGVRFTQMSNDDRQRLEALVGSLRKT